MKLFYQYSRQNLKRVGFMVMTALILSLMNLSGGCEAYNKDDTAAAIDRKELLTLYVDAVIVPQYKSLTDAMNTLKTKTTELCTNPNDSNLASVKNAWQDGKIAWIRTEGHNFGPIADQRLDGVIHRWPLRVNDIDNFFNAGDLSLTALEKQGALTRGLPPFEYMLYGADGNLSIEAFTAGGDRCIYLQSLTSDLVTNTTKVVSAWEAEGDNYRDAFINAGTNTTSFSRQQQALELVINELIHTIRFMEDSKLASPMGKRNKGIAQPGDVESPYSKLSGTFLAANFSALRTLFLGGDSKQKNSIADEIATSNQALYEEILAAITAAETALTAALADDQTIKDIVSSDSAKLDPVFAAVKNLLRLFAADVAGHFAVTPTFSDNDGD